MCQKWWFFKFFSQSYSNDLLQITFVDRQLCILVKQFQNSGPKEFSFYVTLILASLNVLKTGISQFLEFDAHVWCLCFVLCVFFMFLCFFLPLFLCYLFFFVTFVSLLPLFLCFYVLLFLCTLVCLFRCFFVSLFLCFFWFLCFDVSFFLCFFVLGYSRRGSS